MLSHIKTLSLALLFVLAGCATNPATVRHLQDRDYDAVVSFIADGHDVNTIFNEGDGIKTTLLTKAVSGNSLKLTRYLIENGATNINAVFKGNYTSYTLLTRAVDEENVELVKYLISKGADVNLRNTDVTPPLIIASQETSVWDDAKSIEIIDELMAAGADISIVDYDGSTVLHWPAFHNRDSVIQHLCKKYKANPNIQKDYGETPLHNAATIYPYTLEDGYTLASDLVDGNKKRVTTSKNTMSILIKCGGDLSIKNSDGETPVDVYKKSLVSVDNAIKEYRADAADSFQWGKFAALTAGSYLGGAGDLGYDQQASLISAITRDSIAGNEGANNVQQFANEQIEQTERMRKVDSKPENNSSVPESVTNKAKNCSSVVGSYLEGGKYKTHYSVNTDCNGTYCVQVLNNPRIPTSGYGWYCREGRGTKNIIDWKESNGNYLITFSDGRSISRPVTHLKKQ